jgi:uncharacterized phage protein gp47/JayE
MTTSVVCISRTLAAGGEEVGKLVADQLGFQYADEEILDRAAERAGVTRDAVAKAERPPGRPAPGPACPRAWSPPPPATRT